MARSIEKVARRYGIALLVIAAVMPACWRKDPAPPTRPSEKPRTVAQATRQTSESCRACHADIHSAWANTDHALANRTMASSPEAIAALATFPSASAPTGEQPSGADLILGHSPLWQALVPKPGGRWQPHELAYDPAKKEWFNVFGAEGRHAGEWGHWTGRGMNWNSMCAHCHMTGYQKNYDVAADQYRSTWVEHGIGCIQCHGPMPEGHGSRGLSEKPPALAGARQPAAPFHGDRQLMMQTCVPCHARNEQLTLDFQPGDLYHDHYRVTLPVETGLFYPDGQQRDEDFNWTSVLLSRMGHAGVTCMDCHDPHTNQTILPVANNALCLQCHAAPGKVQPGGARATPIDPVAHSHHAAESAGNQCVSCHMPTKTYMQRAPRHDHGWIKPDPLLTKELGIPNACNGCHTDKTVDWAIAQTDAWHGAKMESRQRSRARAVAAAQAGKAEAVTALLGLLPVEDSPAWRATYLLLLAPHVAESPEILRAAEAGLKAVDPLERSAAARALSSHEASRALLRPLLKDPVRLVRLDAAWALSDELVDGSPERKEFDAYLSLSLDQPVGRLRLGQDLANRGRYEGAEKEIRRAAEWDANSPGIHDAHAFVLNALGRSFEAAAKFYRVALLLPNDAQAALRSALAYAESGHLTEAETALRLALQRDARLDRAWYNLGLLLAQTQRVPEAADALRQAETVAPRVADYPYALATVLLRLNDRPGAQAAARRALAIDPNHAEAKQLLGIR